MWRDEDLAKVRYPDDVGGSILEADEETTNAGSLEMRLASMLMKHDAMRADRSEMRMTDRPREEQLRRNLPITRGIRQDIVESRSCVKEDGPQGQRQENTEVVSSNRAQESLIHSLCSAILLRHVGS